MSVQTAKEVVWKKYRIAAPQDPDRQTCCPPPGEYVLTYHFKALVGKRVSHVGLCLSSTPDASCCS